MGTLKKYGKRLIALSLAIVILLVTGLFIIMEYYSQEVTQTLLEQLNQRMETEVSVEDIQLDLFSSFPKASLRFREVNSREKSAFTGTSLLKAGEIALLFNVLDIFRGKYTIEKIILHDAFLNLLVKEDGSVNYKVFENEGSSGNNFSINLKKVHFKNVVVSYIHLPSQQEYLFRIDAGDLEGEFSSNKQHFHFDGTIFSSHIKSGDNVFLHDRQLSLETEMIIDEEEHILYFQMGRIQSEGLDFDVTGNVITGEGRKNLNLAIEVDRSPVKSLIKLIPEAYLEPVSDFILNGEVAISAQISGNFTGNNIPRADILFDLQDGDFAHKKSDLTLSDVSFDGTFSNGDARMEKTYTLTVSNIRSRFKGGKVEGALEISNFIQPRINTRLLTTVQLEVLAGIFPVERLEKISGIMELNLEFRNQLKDFRKFTIEDFISSQTSGSMKISGVNFRLTDSPHNFHDFNGSFSFNNKDLKIEQFSGFVSGNDFYMQGYFRNILAYAFLSDEPIFINADFRSKRFNLDEILETGQDKASEHTRLRFSDRVNYNLNIQIDTFTFRKFMSRDNVGQLIQRNRILYVENTRFNSMDGRVSLSGYINGQNDVTYSMHCRAEFKEVNIHKLFRDFGNFGQQNLTSDHLRGTVDASVDYSSTLTPNLFVDQKSVYTLADVEINNGELIHYEPLNKLSKYVREGEFDHVRFSALKNKIKIQNEIVYIPQMDIESSSMNLNLYGNHTFSNQIDYHVQLLLSEIITRKKAIEEDLGDNFIADDGLGRTKLFLTMTGSAEDPVIRYDTREVRNKISEDLKNERNELKKVLQQEFGFDPKSKKAGADSMAKEMEENKNFKIEWDEGKNNKVTPKPDKKKDPELKKDQPKQQDFIIEWDEKKDTINRNPFLR